MCMTHVMGSDTVKFGVFGKDLEHFKLIVDTFNKSGFNYILTDGFYLLPEFATLFGTTCDVVQRFIEVYI